ncbi:MAG: DUF2213 domain-containing protein, partial [Acetobacteraceae bacterium]
LPYLRNSLIVWTREAIDGIESGKRRQLSASYRYDADMTSGTYEGQPYDGVMRNIRFNHVALVEEGRAGPDVLVDDSLPPDMGIYTMKLSRRAIVAQGALAGWLRPKLANDAKLPDLKAVFHGATAANWKEAKPHIVTRLTDAVRGKLAEDANLREVHGFLDSLDHEGNDQTEPDEMEVVDRRAKDAGEKGGEEKLGGFDETPEEKEERERKEREAKDRRRAKDRRAHDESEEEMKERHEREAKDRRAEDESEEEMKERHEREAKDARDRRAKDARRAHDESEEERKERKEKEERERREAEDRRRASDKAAMDAAINAALAGERKRHVDIREAERVVRPWIGELTMAQDSAEAVYRLALESLGVDVKGVHPSAYRAILQVQPKPGDRPASARLAMDAAGESDFAKRFPNLAAVRHY